MKNKKYEKYLKIAFSLHLVDFLLTCFPLFRISRITGFSVTSEFRRPNYKNYKKRRMINRNNILFG